MMFNLATHNCLGLVAFLMLGTSAIEACNPVDQHAIFLLKNEQQEAIAIKIENGELLDEGEEIVYRNYYRKALEETWDKIERYARSPRAHSPRIKVLACANELDGATSGFSTNFIFDRNHGIKLCNDVVYSALSTKFSSLKMNGIELTDAAKNAIFELGEDAFERMSWKEFTQYISKYVDTEEAARITRTIDFPSEASAIQADRLYAIVNGMKDGDTAIIHLHRLGELGGFLRTDLISDPILVHLNRGYYYLKSASAFELDTEWEVFSKYAMENASGNGTIKLSPSEVFLRAKVLKQLNELTDNYLEKLQKVEETLRTLDPNTAEYAHFSAMKNGLIEFIHYNGRLIHETEYPFDRIFYSIITRRVH